MQLYSSCMWVLSGMPYSFWVPLLVCCGMLHEILCSGWLVQIAVGDRNKSLRLHHYSYFLGYAWVQKYHHLRHWAWWYSKGRRCYRTAKVNDLRGVGKSTLCQAMELRLLWCTAKWWSCFWLGRIWSNAEVWGGWSQSTRYKSQLSLSTTIFKDLGLL